MHHTTRVQQCLHARAGRDVMCSHSRKAHAYAYAHAHAHAHAPSWQQSSTTCSSIFLYQSLSPDFIAALWNHTLESGASHVWICACSRAHMHAKPSKPPIQERLSCCFSDAILPCFLCAPQKDVAHTLGPLALYRTQTS